LPTETLADGATRIPTSCTLPSGPIVRYNPSRKLAPIPNTRDHWDIPGGFCEAGEHPIQTAERELLEETGVHARVIAFIGMWIDDYGSPQADGLQEMTLNVTYLTRPLDEQPIARSGSESAESRWFPLGTTPARLAFPKHVVPALEAAQRLLQMELPPVLDAASSSTW
jgi:ADP-ribose pyrophosphatase YjhB (NUDIX family)